MEPIILPNLSQSLALSAEIKALALLQSQISNLKSQNLPVPPSPSASVPDTLPRPASHPHPFTIAAAESLTVGRVQTLLGLVSGASAYFLGGVTAYSLEQKEKLLGVSLAQARPCAGVSEAIARQLADGARRLFGADIAVATTGFAEPAPDYGAAHPMAWWAVAWDAALSTSKPPRLPDITHDSKTGYSIAGKVEWPGLNRTEAQEATAFAATTALRDALRALRA